MSEQKSIISKDSENPDLTNQMITSPGASSSTTIDQGLTDFVNAAGRISNPNFFCCFADEEDIAILLLCIDFMLKAMIAAFLLNLVGYFLYMSVGPGFAAYELSDFSGFALTACLGVVPTWFLAAVLAMKSDIVPILLNHEEDGEWFSRFQIRLIMRMSLFIASSIDLPIGFFLDKAIFHSHKDLKEDCFWPKLTSLAFACLLYFIFYMCSGERRFREKFQESCMRARDRAHYFFNSRTGDLQSAFIGVYQEGRPTQGQNLPDGLSPILAVENPSPNILNVTVNSPFATPSNA